MATKLKKSKNKDRNRENRLVSIRTKFICAFLLISILPLIAVSLFIQKNNSDTLIEKEQEAMQDLALSKGQSIDQWFHSQLSEMQVAAASDVMKTMNKGRMLDYINMLENRSDEFETMFVLDRDGIVLAHTLRGSIGADYSQYSYVPASFGGKSVISEVMTSDETGNRVVIASTPIINDNGLIVGILAGAANFEALVDTYLTDAEGDSSHSITLVDQQGIIQEGLKEEFIGTPYTDKSLGSLSKLIEKSTKETGISTFNYDNEEYIISYTPIESVGYGLSILTPSDVVLSDLEAVQNSTAVLIIIAAIIIVAVTLLIVQSITKPILILSAKMQKIATGDLATNPIRIKKKDEIGQLGHHFNSMIENIKQLVSELRRLPIKCFLLQWIYRPVPKKHCRPRNKLPRASKPSRPILKPKYPLPIMPKT